MSLARKQWRGEGRGTRGEACGVTFLVGNQGAAEVRSLALQHES